MPQKKPKILIVDNDEQTIVSMRDCLGSYADCLDATSYETTLDGRTLDLTPKEFALLYLLVRHPGRVFSRAYLLDQIWGYEAAAYDRTVDTHVYRLRQKLGTKSQAARRIVAVRGIGYKFERE